MTILCYGDSNTFGYDPRGFLADRYDTPWPEALGSLTNREVRNAGSCGRRVPIRETVFQKNADRIIVTGTSPRKAPGRWGAFSRFRIVRR